MSYQGVWSEFVTKHHTLLILLIYIVLWSHLSGLVSTNPQVVLFHITGHNWICNAAFGAPQTLACNTEPKLQTSPSYRFHQT